MTETLCVICAADLAAPLICQRCEQRIRRDLDHIGAWRKQLHDWRTIDPGTPGRDDRHLLALVDSPIITQSGSPDLTVIAATDPRSRRIVAGWHDTECGDASCDAFPCTDPEHRQDAADDVVCIDHELITEARLIAEQRTLAAPIADVHDAIRILVMSHDWSVRDERVDEHAAVLASCAAALRLVLRDTGDRIIGLCPAAHPERETCGGPLRPAWLGPLPLTPEDQVKPTHVMCDFCGDPWPLDAASLVGLLRVVEVKSFPVDRAWAMDACNIRPDLLRQWVRRKHVRAYSDGQVDLVDVLARLVDAPSVAGA